MALSSFHWIIPRGLAGSGQPGRMSALEKDLLFLKESGIKIIVTLTEEPLDLKTEASLFEQIHFPIVDMKAPKSLQQTFRLCKSLHARYAQEPVLMHCEMGTGRTGTLLAAMMIHQGLEVEEAIEAIREIEPLYVRNSLQESFVKRYYTFYSFNK